MAGETHIARLERDAYILGYEEGSCRGDWPSFFVDDAETEALGAWELRVEQVPRRTFPSDTLQEALLEIIRSGGFAAVTWPG